MSLIIITWMVFNITPVISFGMAMWPCKPCDCFNDTCGVTADCRHRHLTSIPVDISSDVTSLLLAHNNITNLSALSQFKRLRHLDVSFNKLSRMQSRCFESLSRLEELNLEGNYLPLNSSGYATGVFQGLGHLRCLRLNNNIKYTSPIGMDYPSHELAEIHSLEVLFIDGIPNGKFREGLKYLTRLSNLTMSGRIGTCNIENITADYFTNLPHLELLNMTDCCVQHIHVQAFNIFATIKTIDISSNNDLGLKNVLNMLHGLQNSSLEILYFNGIVKKTDTCVQMSKQFGEYLRSTSLKELHIDDNYIVSAEEGTLRLLPQTLEVMSVRNSRLVFGTYFSDLLFMTHLRKLDLSDLKVGNIDIFGMEKSLNQQNRIFPLPPKLEEFYSEDGTFRVAFDNVSFSTNHLRKLSYRKNAITRWKGPMYGLNHLEEMDLSENFCDHASPGCLEGYYNLKILRVNSNYMGAFLKDDTKGELFGHSQNLIFLDLSLNKIDDLPVNIFRSQINLETLNLSHNSISIMNVKVSHMINLTELNLSFNPITSLNREFTSQLNKLSRHSKLKVDLSGNPFICSCDTLWFIQWMIVRTFMFQHQHNYICSSESGWLKGRNVFEILTDLETHCFSYLGLAMGLLAAVTSVVCLVLAAITFRYRWKLRYLYYVARGRYRGTAITENGEARNYEYDAFVSYADDDREFALHTFIREIENKDNIYLCLHHRDFLPGNPIAANILSAIQRSRHIVVVLSPQFLDSYWCRWEFEMARMESLYTERNMVVLVKYQEVNPRLVPRDMLYMMHTQTYIEFPQDPNDQDTFWTALRQSIIDP